MPFSGNNVYHVSVIITTWNRKQELRRCLDSVRRQDYPSIETVVVDNNSTDGTNSMIRQDYPGVRYVGLEENIGIGARNRGVDEAEGDLIVQLHDDSQLPSPTVVSRIVDKFRQAPDMGAAGFRIIDADGNDMNWFHWPLEGDLLQGFKSPTFQSCGAAIRPEMFELTGGFWEPYFLYMEDRDLAARIINSGSEIRYFPLISIRHTRSQKNRDETRQLYHTTRNTIWFLWRNYGVIRALGKTLVALLGLARQALSRRGGFSVYLRGIVDAAAGFGDVFRTRQPVKPERRDWVEGRFSSSPTS